MRHFILLLLPLAFVFALVGDSSAGQEVQAIHSKDGAMFAQVAPSVHPLAEIMLSSTSGHGAVTVRRRVPQDYPTIQAAIDASGAGDTVLVSEGTYYENIRYRGKAIVVGSLFLIDRDTAHISRTIIDGRAPVNPDSGSVVSFINGEDTTSVLCGFTITSGTGTKTYWFNAWYRFGGGVLCHNSGARITKNVITRNRIRSDGVYGGGIGTYSELMDLPFVILEGNAISRNYAQEDALTTMGSGGGGATISGVHCRVVDNVFERDTVIGKWLGGGGLIIGATPPATIHPLPSALVRANIFRANVLSASSSEGADGGGMMATWTKEVTIADNLFENNVVTGTAGWAQGGGLCVQDSVVGSGRKIIMGNRFVNNRCSTGGLIYPSGAAVLLFCTVATIDGNEIADNSAQGGSGGGIVAWQSSFRIQNNIITRNASSVSAGGVGVAYRPFMMTEQLLVNNTFFDNHSVYAGGFGVRGSGTTVVALNNILWADTAQYGKEIYVDAGAAAEVQYCDVQGGYVGTGNIVVNPQFEGSTFQLSNLSQCIGAGRDSVQVSGEWYRVPSGCYLRGPRPNPPGSRPDIGACENPLAIPVGVKVAQSGLPAVFALEQNYPNPFNPSTTIKYELPKSSEVRLSIFDILGREVSVLVDERRDAGLHEVKFDGASLSSGVYVYRLTTGDFVQSRKLIILK